jgi:hypothetical protein
MGGKFQLLAALIAEARQEFGFVAHLVPNREHSYAPTPTRFYSLGKSVMTVRKNEGPRLIHWFRCPNGMFSVKTEKLRDLGGLSVGSVDGYVHAVGPSAP